jgi:hypothetical protein
VNEKESEQSGVTCPYKIKTSTKTAYLFSSGSISWVGAGGILECNDRFKVRDGKRTGVGMKICGAFMLLVLWNNHKVSLMFLWCRLFGLVWTIYHPTRAFC